MFRFLGLWYGTLVRLIRSRRSLLLENLALRQQLVVLKRRHPRPRLDLFDKLFWLLVRRCWSSWVQRGVQAPVCVLLDMLFPLALVCNHTQLCSERGDQVNPTRNGS